jgi:hypothetical protein
MEIDMAKAIGQISTKTRARKPAKKGRQGTRKNAPLRASADKVKRSAPRNLGPLKLTPTAKALHAELRRLYDDAYRSKDAPPDNAPRKAWDAYRARLEKAHETFDAALHAALERHGRFIGDAWLFRPFFVPRQRMSLSELTELAVLGEFSLEADLAVASTIRRAAGLRL